MSTVRYATWGPWFPIRETIVERSKKEGEQRVDEIIQRNSTMYSVVQCSAVQCNTPREKRFGTRLTRMRWVIG